MPVTVDPEKAFALIVGAKAFLSALLASCAVEPVNPHLGGFETAKKKKKGTLPILDIRGLNKFLHILPFHLLNTAEVLCVVNQQEW